MGKRNDHAKWSSASRSLGTLALGVGWSGFITVDSNLVGPGTVSAQPADGCLRAPGSANLDHPSQHAADTARRNCGLSRELERLWRRQHAETAGRASPG